MKKNSDLITYTFDLDLEEAMYDLKSVIVHSGTIRRGHYISMAKRDSQWMYFDDEVSKKIGSDDQVLDEDAYILIYGA